MFRVWAVFYDHFSMEAVGQCLLKVGSVSGWAELSFPMLTAAFWRSEGAVLRAQIPGAESPEMWLGLCLVVLGAGWGQAETRSHPQPLSCAAGAIPEVPLAPGLAGGGGFPRNVFPSFPWCVSLPWWIWVQDRAILAGSGAG